MEFSLNRQYQGMLHTILSMGQEENERLYLPSMVINHRMSEGFPTLNFKKLDIKKLFPQSAEEIIYAFDSKTKFLSNSCHFWREISHVDIYRMLPYYLMETGYIHKILSRYHSISEGEITILLNLPYVSIQDRPAIIELLNKNPDKFKLPSLVGLDTENWWHAFPNSCELVNYETFE